MNTLIAGSIGALMLVAGTALPSHAAPPASTVTASFTGSGYWSSGLSTQPRAMRVGFDGTLTGTFVAAPATAAGALSCSATGSGVESLVNGTGSLYMSCSGVGASLNCLATPLLYQRVGTETVMTGNCRVVVSGIADTVAVQFAHTSTPASVPTAYRYTAAGTLVGES